MSQYTFRRAIPADFQGVRAISEHIYGGVDYIPFMFHKYLRQPNRFTFVALHGERLVAMVSFYTVDGGRTLIGEGLRRDPAYKNNFYAQMLLEKTRDVVKDEFPVLRMSRGSSVSPEHWYGPTSIPHDNVLNRVIVEGMADVPVTHLRKCFTDTKMASFEKLYPIIDVMMASKNDLENILSNEESVKHLFPHDVILVCSHPYAPDTINSDLLWDECKDVYLTKIHNTLKAMSISSSVPCHRGVLYEVNYYGDADESTILAHVIKHINRASTTIEEETNIIFSVLLPQEVATIKTIARIQELCSRLLNNDSSESRILAQFVFCIHSSFPSHL